MATKMVKISKIKIGKRYRSKLGDFSSLQESIKSFGLLHPIGVTPDSTLIFGQRRLAACEELGHEEIECRVLDLDDLKRLQVEHSENEDRAPMSADDKLQLAAAIKSKIKERRGNPNLTIFDQNTQEPASSSNVGHLAHIGEEPEKGKRTDDHVAKAAGFNNRKEMERSKKVKEKCHPDVWDAFQNNVIKLGDAFSVIDQPHEKQLQALARVKDGTAKTLKAGLVEPKQTQKARAAVRAAKNHKVPSEDSEPEKDCNGRPIPAELTQAMADGAAMTEYSRLLEEMHKLVSAMRLDKNRGALIGGTVLNDIWNLKHAFLKTTFYCVCVYCEGHGDAKGTLCSTCRGGGWMNKSQFEQVPKEKRKVS